MDSKKQSPTKQALREFKKLMRKASTRANIYQTLSEKYGIKASSIRSAASRAGLTSKRTSLNHIFSEEQEEALVEVCIRQSRKYRPFTIPDFIRVAKIFSGTHRQSSITRKFVNCFVRRHRDVLRKRRGKLTSPKRISSVVLSNTRKFIKRFDSKMRRKKSTQKYCGLR